jgi:fluoride exporter
MSALLSPWLVNLLVVGTGGALGTLLRYGLSQVLGSYLNAPWPILLVNVLGCGLFGWLSAQPIIAQGNGGLSGSFLGSLQGLLSLTPQLRLFLLTGLLGGFTTFSSYMHEAHLTGQGQPEKIILTLLLTPTLGYGAYYLGLWLARS